MVTKYHKLGAKNNRNLFSCSFGDQKSKIKVLADHAPSEASRGESILASSTFWWLQAFLGLWQHHSSLCLHLLMAVFPLCLSVSKCSSSYKDTSHVGLGPTRLQYNLVFTWWHQQRPYFQIRSPSQERGLGLQHGFFGGGHNSTHNSSFSCPLIKLLLPIL